jgi:glycosyltransferase involved in cell wall biosynthesis
MWESTEVPAWRVDELNRSAELVYVPCRQNAESFAASGVEVPVRVLHHGVDAARFPLLERPEGRPFTFGTYGDLSHRKGLDALLRAFREEFEPGEPVQLLVKSGGQLPPDLGGGDPRIRVETGFRDQAALLELLRDMDAFVMPSRGEGFGLCGLEAMATGLPLIATDWSGPADYVRDCGALPLRYELADAGGVTVGNSHFFGEWAEPDVGHLRELMRGLASDRAAARERGLRCAAAVRERWGWDRPALQLRQDLDALVRVAA